MKTTSAPPTSTSPLARRSPEFLDAGMAYLRAAQGDHRGGKRFGATTTVNIVCLAVENLLYGLCLAHDYLPEGSCLHSLATEATAHTPFSEQAARRTSQLGALLNVCSLTPTTDLASVTTQDADHAVVWGSELVSAIHHSLPPESSSPCGRRPRENPPCTTPA